MAAPRTCYRCGRQGNYNFSLVDRYADGSEEWRCKASSSCRQRAKRAEADRPTVTDGHVRTPTQREAPTVPDAPSKLWIADADEGVWHTLDILGDTLYRSACGWEVDGRNGILWPQDAHEQPRARAKRCDECVARELGSINAEIGIAAVANVRNSAEEE